MSSNRNSFIISKGFRHYFTSSILLMVAEQLCATIDMILVGNFVSAEAFAAIDLALPVESLVRGLFLLFVGGSGVIASRLTGNQQLNQAHEVLTLSTVIATATALVMTVLGLIFLNPITSVLCDDPSLSGHLQSYLKAFLYGLVPMALYAGLSESLNVDGKPGIVTMAASIACAVDIVLDIVLMRGFGMGVEGQAYATICSYVLPVLAFVIYMALGKTGYSFTLPKKSMGKLTAKILESGVPFCTPYAVNCLMLLAVNSLVLSRLGSDGLYIWSVGYQVYSIGIMFMECIGGTVLVTMGSMLAGCHDTDGLKFLMSKCLQMTGASMGLVVLVVCLFPSAALAMFGDTEVATHGAETGIRLISLFLLPYTFVSLKAYLTQALGREKEATVSFTVISFIIVPAMFIWSLFSPQSMFWAVPVSGLAYVAVDMLVSEYRRHHSHAGSSPVFLIPALDKSASICLSIPYSDEGMQKALMEISGFLDSCDLQPALGMGINLCCEEMILEIVSHNREKGEGYVFDLFINEEDDSVKVTVKDAGQPFNPVKKFDKTAAESLEEDDLDDISLRIINNFCKELSYNFMYGQNVIFMMFGKS